MASSSSSSSFYRTARTLQPAPGQTVIDPEQLIQDVTAAIGRLREGANNLILSVRERLAQYQQQLQQLQSQQQETEPDDDETDDDEEDDDTTEPTLGSLIKAQVPLQPGLQELQAIAEEEYGPDKGSEVFAATLLGHLGARDLRRQTFQSLAEEMRTMGDEDTEYTDDDESLYSYED